MPSFFNRPDPDAARKALAAAVERDVGVIMRACMPLDWKEPGPFTEPAVALHCTHPIEQLQPNFDKVGEVFCAGCKTLIEPEIVRDRLDQWQRSQDA